MDMGKSDCILYIVYLIPDQPQLPCDCFAERGLLLTL